MEERRLSYGRNGSYGKLITEYRQVSEKGMSHNPLFFPNRLLSARPCVLGVCEVKCVF